MFGVPDPLIATGFGSLGECDAVRECVGGGLVGSNDRQVENRQPGNVHAAIMASICDGSLVGASEDWVVVVRFGVGVGRPNGPE